MKKIALKFITLTSRGDNKNPIAIEIHQIISVTPFATGSSILTSGGCIEVRQSSVEVLSMLAKLSKKL